MTRQTIKGARALVTGATGGIGQAIARALHAEGAELVLSGRRTEVLEPLAKELGATVIAADLANLDDVGRLLKESGAIDILVANAALPASGALLEYTHEEILRNVSVNLTVPILMARDTAEAMAGRGHGQIVMIGSVSGKTASSQSSMYNATKFGLRGFSLALRQDLADQGVGVSLVEPGFVRDAGMFVEAQGKLPKGVRTVTPEQVAKKVIKRSSAIVPRSWSHRSSCEAVQPSVRSSRRCRPSFRRPAVARPSSSRWSETSAPSAEPQSSGRKRRSPTSPSACRNASVSAAIHHSMTS